MGRHLMLAMVLTVALAAPAEARPCRSVSGYTVTATGVTCKLARDSTRAWIRTGRAPRGWRCVRRRGQSLSCARGSTRAFGAYRRR